MRSEPFHRQDCSLWNHPGKYNADITDIPVDSRAGIFCSCYSRCPEPAALSMAGCWSVLRYAGVSVEFIRRQTALEPILASVEGCIRVDGSPAGIRPRNGLAVITDRVEANQRSSKAICLMSLALALT